MTASISTRQERTVARITSVLVKEGKRLEGNPVCWAEVYDHTNGTYYVNPIRFKCDGTFSLNKAFDEFEIIPVKDAPRDIQIFLNRRWGQRSR